MYTYIWIEGWENLNEFCQKRFNDRPYMCECTGHCGGVRIHNIYKADKDGHYHEMYFLYMEHDPNAPYNEREPELKKVKLDVYLTIHKVVEVETDKYYQFAGEINDGEYLPPKIEFDEQEIKNDFLSYTTLPHEFARLVDEGVVGKWDLYDASGWELDDVEINIIKK